MDFLSDPATLEAIVFYITATIASASAIAAVFDSDNSDPIVQKIIAVVDILALNFGKAKNADRETDVLGNLPPDLEDPIE